MTEVTARDVRADVLAMYLGQRRFCPSRAATFASVRGIYACMIAAAVVAGVEPRPFTVAAFRVADGIVGRWRDRGFERLLVAVSAA